MTDIRIRALVSALGLKRGDVADVELTPTTDSMINNGFWVWLDAPAPEPEFVITPVVEARKPRKPRAKKADNVTETLDEEGSSGDAVVYHTTEAFLASLESAASEDLPESVFDAPAGRNTVALNED